MKKLLYIIPILLMFFSSCEKEENIVINNINDTVYIDTTTTIQTIDTAVLINKNWEYECSYINNQMVANEDVIINITDDATLLAYCNGYLSLYIKDNVIVNYATKWGYLGNYFYKNGSIYWYDDNHYTTLNNIKFKVLSLSDSTLSVEYYCEGNGCDIRIDLKEKI